MTQYVCYGINSKVIYLEGSKPYIHRCLQNGLPTHSEPIKVRKEEDYYAELDAEE